MAGEKTNKADSLIPLYGFLRGDTMGLVILVRGNETVRDLGTKLQNAARVRVAPKSKFQIFYRGRVVDLTLKIWEVGFEALEKFELVQEGSR